VRGRILPEHRNPVNRFSHWALSARHSCGIASPQVYDCPSQPLCSPVSVYPVIRIGSEFMPPLNEGTLLYMPVSLPSMSVTKAAGLIQVQDKIIKSFPEVDSVFGKAGRARNGPPTRHPSRCFETVINLKPQEGLAGRDDHRQTDFGHEPGRLQFPWPSTNDWTMPIQARIDMLSTGIRTPVGIKVYGGDPRPGSTTSPGKSRRFVRKVPGHHQCVSRSVYWAATISTSNPTALCWPVTASPLATSQDVVRTALGAESHNPDG